MIVNVIHRPKEGKLYDMFRLQQDMAHQLGLKVTILVPYDFMFMSDVVNDILRDHEEYGDEIGIWVSDLNAGKIQEIVACKEIFLWLYTKENKEKILKAHLDKFRQTFSFEPASFGSYHMDAISMQMLHELCPSIKISVAGCFEEGVKVFHGCNNSWYLFNEGMPWGPWYPAKENSLRPAADESEWCGIIGVPHLCRDMVLSYEGRNDFFASHPANVQRAMANDGAIAPYALNLLDIYRFQERYNDGFSYTNVFVGPNWLSGSMNVQDSDEITQGLYFEYLEYYAKLQAEGKLMSMHMSEFADWYVANVPIGKAQIFNAKEILYGSKKEYFWYCNSSMRITFDMFQGGSIGDLRPFVSKMPRCTGADMPDKMMGSNPYLIHSQYRSGNAHHCEDGARSTFLLEYQGEVLDLANYETKIERVTKDDDIVLVELKKISLAFKNGVEVELKTKIFIYPDGRIGFDRQLLSTTNPDATFLATEYIKGCYGTTEYPEKMEGICLSVTKEGKRDSIEYSYEGRCLMMEQAECVSAYIPALETEISLFGKTGDFLLGKAEEGYLFNPYYTLYQTAEISLEKGVVTELCLKKRM